MTHEELMNYRLLVNPDFRDNSVESDLIEDHGSEKKSFSLSEEKACTLLKIFNKKSSVLYDIKSMTDILASDKTSAEMKGLISNTIYFSIRNMRHILHKHNNKELSIFSKYWEITLASLPLVKLNVEIKTNRDN